jgi:dTDP-4-dehydrorhamnose reductase
MERILLFGGSGILGTEVLRILHNKEIECLAPRSSDLDIRVYNPVTELLQDFQPTWIINCAAWTNVDGAENSFEDACELNEIAVVNIGTAAKSIGCKVIHISTDYVFDGESETPYEETSSVNAINRYGESKLRGEIGLLAVLPESFVVRTSWLYGVNGKNFVKTIAGKALRNEPARVVDDQIGSPTSARDLASGILSIVSNRPDSGIYNYSNNGSCSWFELAQTIYTELGVNQDLVQPISSSSLDFVAKRPKFTLLSKEKWKSAGLSEVPNWEDSLQLLLPEIVSELR